MEFDPSTHFLHENPSPLESFFEPKVVALIGATEAEGSVGRTMMQNLVESSFQGKVIPINPKRDRVLGIKAYPNVGSVEEKIDLAVIVVPAKFVPSVVKECGEKKIPSAVIISAGFKEMGESGILLENEIMEHAKKANLRIIGPNCLGIMNPSSGLNATFAASMAMDGNLAFVSQSGALCTAVLDWSLKERVGFSSFVSIGSMVDVNWGDLISHFGRDSKTKAILIYMESIGDTRSFLSAAREVSLSKPIIVIKAGRTEESAKAAASHTGALAGSDEIFSAALKRVGVLRVDTISELFSMAEALSKQPIPKGPSLSIVTNAGGPGVIATDALISSGGKLARIHEASMQAYNEFLPESWSHNNPIDILGDAGSDIYEQAVRIALKDENSDGVLVILTPQDMSNPTETAQKLSKFSQNNKPLLTSFIGAKKVEEGRDILSKNRIPSFAFPDEACKTFSKMWSHKENLDSIYETAILPENFHVDKEKVEKILEKAMKEKRVLLDEYESKKVLEAYQIPIVKTEIAKSSDEAVEIANTMEFPLVLKIYSQTITHKSDVGGVKLNLQNINDVKKAYEEIELSVTEKMGKEHFQGVTVQPMVKLDGIELILGSTVDPDFGPTILFGTGGKYVEVFKDRSLALPPLTSVLASRMMKRTKVYSALQGVRGDKPVDMKKLESLLVQFSRLIVDFPRISELDINPLLASEKGLIALDARVILHDIGILKEDLPKSAIRPYPDLYVKEVKGTLFRPIRPEDENKMVAFHKSLSEETVHQRYFQAVPESERTAHDVMQRICFNDYDREIAIVAEKEDSILGICRLSRSLGTNEATFSMMIRDQDQNKGLGKSLLSHVLEISKNEGITRLFAYMLEENEHMKSLCSQLGFSLSKDEDLILAEMKP